MTDLAPPSPPVAAPAVSAPPAALPIGMPVAPPAFDAPEAQAARDTIRARIDEKDFRTKLLAQDPAARAEWDRLHKSGYPAVPQVASAEDVNNQAAARNAEL